VGVGVGLMREKIKYFDFCFSCKMEGCNSGFTTKQCLQFHYRKSHGLTDEEMPKIQREIPYTLSAYSGGLVTILKNFFSSSLTWQSK
jgi:hypothetical protein